MEWAAYYDGEKPDHRSGTSKSGTDYDFYLIKVQLFVNALMAKPHPFGIPAEVIVDEGVAPPAGWYRVGPESITAGRNGPEIRLSLADKIDEKAPAKAAA